MGREEETHEQQVDALTRDWAAKIEFLLANAENARPKQKIKYVAYIDSLQAKQQDLPDILQALLSSTDLAQEKSPPADFNHFKTITK